MAKENKLISFDGSYNHQEVAQDLYDFWVNKKLFSPNHKAPYFSCVMAPPNLTGVLHIGHAWELSLSDAYLRLQKMQGKNVNWAPGYDHAGISTQAKFEKTLSEAERNAYFALPRQQRVQKILDWALGNSTKIIQQVKTLGISVNWDNFHFTLDENSEIAVRHAFKSLYDKKYIYREKKLVNWDVKLNTAISNIEVQNRPTEQLMYYITYRIKNSKEKLTVATTRPETIFVDAAVFVNPKDKRYKKFLNKEAINPLTDEAIKIMADSYVDQSFGTGVMKCTPAHDVNDYALGKKYKLPALSCIDFDGKLNKYAKQFAGLDRLEARSKIADYLESKKLLIKVEKITSNVGYSERSDAVIEPLLSEQWFIKLSAFAPRLKKAINNSKEFKMMPKTFLKLMQKWLNSCDDWCISRQLVWGHRIPVWYHKKTKKIYVGIKEPKNINDYVQDEDVLDTWFSSSLWPLICFGWPNTKSKQFQNGYPNTLMVMGFDILFFWGIKMMFQGLFHANKLPFNNLLIHGLIRDESGRKMSKSLGNVIDPMVLIDKYGTDALRVYLTSNTSLGEDTNYQEKKLIDASNFLNKLWNATKYIQRCLNEHQDLELKKPKTQQLSEADKWILKQYDFTLKKVTYLANKFEFSLTNKYLYKFIWNDFCNTYLEFAKVTLNTSQAATTLWVLKYLLNAISHLLHPFAPFLTERIYQAINNQPNKFLLESKWPEPFGLKSGTKFEIIVEMITALRNFKNKAKIPFSQPIDISIIIKKDSKLKTLINNSQAYFKLVNCKVNKICDDKTNLKGSSLIGNNCEIVVTDTKFSNTLKEILDKKIKDLQFEVERSEKILANQNFVKNAPAAKVQLEKDKLQKYKEELAKVLAEAKVN